MGTQIEGATGKRNGVEVDDSFRFHTFATTQSDLTSIIVEGGGYSITTNVIHLTEETDSAVLYALINEDSDVIITNLAFSVGDSVGGTGPAIFTQHFAPSGGTIVSDASPAAVINLNGTVNNTLSNETKFYVGGEGKTLTGSLGATSEVINVGGLASINPDRLIVSKGASLGIVVTPPEGNTSMKLSITFKAYIFDDI